MTPLTVEVRDFETREPVVGARVMAEVPSQDHPKSVATFLKLTGPVSSEGVTDNQGRANVQYVIGRPVRFFVWAPGQGPCSVLVESGLDDGVIDWTRVPELDEGRALELRAGDVTSNPR